MLAGEVLSTPLITLSHARTLRDCSSRVVGNLVCGSDVRNRRNWGDFCSVYTCVGGPMWVTRGHNASWAVTRCHQVVFLARTGDTL